MILHSQWVCRVPDKAGFDHVLNQAGRFLHCKAAVCPFVISEQAVGRCFETV